MKPPLILESGTYENYSVKYDGDIILTGNINIIGNFIVFSTTGMVDAAFANITGSGGGTMLLGSVGTDPSLWKRCCLRVGSINVPNMKCYLYGGESYPYFAAQYQPPSGTQNLVVADYLILWGFGLVKSDTEYGIDYSILSADSNTITVNSLAGLVSVGILSNGYPYYRNMVDGILHAIVQLPNGLPTSILMSRQTIIDEVAALTPSTFSYFPTPKTAPVLTLGSGTYTNYNNAYVGDIVLTGNITIVGDFKLRSYGGTIDTSAATITSSSSGTMVLAAGGVFDSAWYASIRTGNINIPNMSLHLLVEPGAYYKTSCALTNTTITCGPLYLYGRGVPVVSPVPGYYGLEVASGGSPVTIHSEGAVVTRGLNSESEIYYISTVSSSSYIIVTFKTGTPTRILTTSTIANSWIRNFAWSFNTRFTADMSDINDALNQNAVTQLSMGSSTIRNRVGSGTNSPISFSEIINYTYD